MLHGFQHLGITDDECEGDVPERCSDSSYSSCDSVKRSATRNLATRPTLSSPPMRRIDEVGIPSSLSFGVMTINR